MVESLQFLVLLVMLVVRAVKREVVNRLWRKPTSNCLYLPAGSVLDLCRSKQQLVLENALLRQQLIVLRRQVSRPHLTNADRALLVLLVGKLRRWKWKSALLIVQPDTLLRWHRRGFRLFWKRKSTADSRKPRLPTETIDLIRQMAVENHLWGAERIREELLKLDIRVCKRTIQKYMRQARKPGPSSRKPSQNWCNFVRNHAHQIWAADFLSVYDLFFRPLFIFFIIELGSRRVVHFGVTQSPTDEWTAQQLREATPFGQVPRFLIRDNDNKYAEKVACVAEGSGIEILKTPYKAPKANAFCERFLGTVRRECLDHVVVLSENHLQRVVKEYVNCYNKVRPHQGIKQQTPEGAQAPVRQISSVADRAGPKIVSLPILGGLHHDYRRVA